MPQLVRHPTAPKYHQLRGLLRMQILSGARRPGERLPSEAELRQEYGVSQITVRRAVQDLVNEGLVRTEQGRGTFVADPRGDSLPAVRRLEAWTLASRERIFSPREMGTLQGMAAVAAHRGATVSLHSMEGNESPRETLAHLRVRGSEAVAFIGWASEPLLEALTGAGVPVVLANKLIRPCPVPRVGPDLRAGAHLGVTHLLGLGHRRLGIVLPPVEMAGELLLAGVEDAVREAGLDLSQVRVARAMPEIAEGAAALAALFDRKPWPRALFVHGDLAAIGVIQAAQARGLRVPEDLAVVGHGGLELGTLISPRLTTVDIRTFEVGVRAGHVLLDWLAGAPDAVTAASEARNYWIAPDLLVRESCGGLEAAQTAAAARPAGLSV